VEPPLIDPLNAALRALRDIQCPAHIQPNENGTAYRVTSGAFIPGTDGSVSIDLEESLLRANLEMTSRYGHLPKTVALVSHTVASYKAQDYKVIHTPIPGNDHHGSATTARKNNALRRAARAMAEQVNYVVPIDPDLAVALGAPPLKHAPKIGSGS